MCDPTVMAIVAVGTAGMQVAQGYAQQSGYKQEAENQRLAGRQALQAASVESNQIREASARELGAIRARQAANNVDITSGSPADVGGHVAQDDELKALHKLHEGRLGNWQQQYAAQISKQKGKAAVVSGYVNAAQTLLTSAISGGYFNATPATLASTGSKGLSAGLSAGLGL